MNLFGYSGNILKIDLSDGNITILHTHEYAERFLGGRGIAAKIYWDEVAPETNAFDPENHLIYITGPLAGFTRFAGCRWQICGKSPAMKPESFAYANFGGSWGAWLKYAGYDGLVITGKANRPVYIYIDEEDTVEIRDASFLWGSTTVDTEALLKERLGNTIKSLEIGPAGENLVLFSTILAADNSSGSNAFASVMGSKYLKAIAVRADKKKRPVAADPDELRNLAGQVLQLKKDNTEKGRQRSLTGHLSACHGCINGCTRRSYKADNGRNYKSLCQATIVYMRPAMEYNDDGTEVYRLATRLCDQYGLDTAVMQPIIDWLSKCYKAGILSDEDIGLPLSKIGGADFIKVLTKKIAYREDFGDILANGIHEASKYLGKKAEKLITPDIITRGGETNDYDPRLILTNSLIYATEPRRPIQLLHASAFPLIRWLNWNAGLDGAFVSSEIFKHIAEIYWGGSMAGDFSKYQNKALAAVKIQEYGYIKESAILCDLAWPIYQVHSPDHDLELGTMESRIISAVIGRDLNEKELLRTGERIFNLQRAILMRQGWEGRKGDSLLDYLHEDPVEGVYFSPECMVPGKSGNAVSRKGAVVEREQFEDMKSEYYSLRGWDVETGFQREEKLVELELDDVAQELEKRGLLK